MALSFSTEIRWQPWSTVPRDGTVVLTLLYNGEVWVGKWVPEESTIPDNYVGLLSDDLTVGWCPLPDRLKEVGAALTAGKPGAET